MVVRENLTEVIFEQRPEEEGREPRGYLREGCSTGKEQAVQRSWGGSVLPCWIMWGLVGHNEDFVLSPEWDGTTGGL